MPVKAGALNHVVMAFGESSLLCHDEDDHQGNDTPGHMQAMESGQEVVAGSKEAACDREVVVDHVDVVRDLDDEECGPQKNSYQQVLRELLLVALRDCLKPEHHGQAGADQDKGVDGEDRCGEMLGGIRPGIASEAKDDVASNEPGKEHDLGSEENPHSKFGAIDSGGGEFELGVDA